MNLIGLLSELVLEQPLESNFMRIKGLVTSEEYEGNIFELYTDKHGIDRAIRTENVPKVTLDEILDKFRRAIPQMNPRFFGKIRNQKSPIINKEWIFKDSKSGQLYKNPASRFAIVEIKDNFFQMVLLIRDYDNNSNYISFEIVTILRNGTPLANLYNPRFLVQKLNIFLEHVSKSEIITIFV